MKRFIALGVLLLAFGVNARADSFSSYINTSQGGDIGNSQYGGTFTVTKKGGSPFLAFCVDLNDHVGFGLTNFTGTEKYNDLTGSPSYNSSYSDVANRVGYILTKVWEPGVKTASFNASVQAALWDVANNYGFVGNTETNAILALVGLPGSDGSGPGHYLQSGDYQSGTFMIIPDASAPPHGEGPLQYQVLVGVVPEPSTMAIAGLGALGFLAYGLRRRKAS